MDEYILDDFASYWEEVSYKRKELITKEGDTEKYLYFVVDGVQHIYSSYNDREVTLVFSYAPSFSGIIDSLLLNVPSKLYLETLTTSSMLRLHINDLNKLIAKYTPIQNLLRIGMAGVISGQLERQVEILAYTAEEKFKTLLRRSPQVLNLIPHKYLASYIGVDPTTFSKMLKNVRI